MNLPQLNSRENQELNGYNVKDFFSEIHYLLFEFVLKRKIFYFIFYFLLKLTLDSFFEKS